MKILWTETAVNHLSAIYSYVAQNSAQYAQTLVEKIIKRSEQVTLFPRSGRTVPEFNNQQIREIIEGNYRIIYYIRPEQIEIIAVIHGKESINLEKN